MKGTEITFVNGFQIKIYTNKNSSIFKEAASILKREIIEDKTCSILYDDYNPNQDVLKKWNDEKLGSREFVRKITPLSKTLKMDDKVSFTKKMMGSFHIPPSYLDAESLEHDYVNNIIKDDDVFFVKSTGSSLSKGVKVMTYKEIMEDKIKCFEERVVQKSFENPMLFDNKRYKTRVYVVLHKNAVYLSRHALTTRSYIDYQKYHESIENLNDMNIIYQNPKVPFFNFKDTPEHEKVFNNIKIAVTDFKVRFREEINNIAPDEFCILGFDFVSNTDGDVHIIEVNHRSNYGHPKQIRDQVDIPFIYDFLRLETTMSTQQTQFILI